MFDSESVHTWVAENWHLDMTLADWWQRLADAGFSHPSWPVGLGGLGLKSHAVRSVIQALGMHGVIAPPMGNGPNMGAPTILNHATPQQIGRFIPGLANGQDAWCQLFSEPGAGSDLASLATRAERDGDEYVITGQKVWNSAADVSSWGMLLARTNPDAPKHRGITFFMVDMNQPGIEVRPLVQMNGGAEFCEVFLTEVRAKVSDIIGEVNDGWNVARTTLTYERQATSAGRVRGLVPVTAGQKSGNLQHKVGELLEDADRRQRNPKQRVELLLGGRAMVSLARQTGGDQSPVLRDRVGRYYIDNELYRLTSQRSVDNAKGGRPGPESSILKLCLAMLAHQSRDLSLALLGAEGMLLGDDAREGGRYQKAALSSFVPSLGGGTNEIQRNILGERNLGLPREPGNETDIAFRDLRRS